MSDIMRPIPFEKLMSWALDEYETRGTFFGVKKLYRHESDKKLPIFDEWVETPFGPAAGPHTQLAQNLIAAYVGGSRFFELKTVQIIDGEDLPVSKPCIKAEDEGYNVEWSTELTVPDALAEYVKAWFAIKLLSKQFGLGSPDGFVFNMSVGYDLEGIRSPKIDAFIEGLKDASGSELWLECRAWAKGNLGRLDKLDAAYVEGISPRVCRSITLSTLHGCPADEIERIASYLITEKKLHTYIKCNPTLLGYDFVRETMDSTGYGYLGFDDHHFKADLQFEDALPMFRRLMALAGGAGLEFGIKLTNTFPVAAAGELPGDEMYMSGKSLYPLAISLAARVEEVFGGKLRLSYSGGADQFNIGDIFRCGVWPITVATTLLKPGGYNRLLPMAETLAKMEYRPFDGVDVPALSALARGSLTDSRYMKSEKADPKRREKPEGETGFGCKTVCGTCADVCPNRANIVVALPGGKNKQLVHLDKMCNECGNCASFCPYAYVPYRDKFTLFADAADMDDSGNTGFCVLDSAGGKIRIRLDGAVREINAGEAPGISPEAGTIVEAILSDYGYCL